MQFSNRFRLTLLAAAACLPLASGAVSAAPKAEPVAEISTSLGDFAVQLDAQRAPITVANFIAYADEGFYDGTIFHRVIDGFMIQGGGFTPDMKQKRATHGSIVNEARGGLLNKRGTIAMARTSEPHSATCQWFVNTVDNDFLDAKNARDGWGYAVFGRVIRGMDVIDKISAVKTGSRRGMNDVPLETVKILSVKIKR